MPRMPQYVQQTAPAVVGQPGAGISAQAEAGVGQALERLGAGIVQMADRQEVRSDILAAGRARRQLADWHYAYFQKLPQRRRELAATQIDPQTGSNVTGYELERGVYPAALDAEFNRLQEGLSARARQMLEQDYNNSAPAWAHQAAGALDTLELEDVTAEALDLAGKDQPGEAMKLFNLYQDRYSPLDRQRYGAALAVASENARVGAVSGYLQSVAEREGWPAAAALLADAGFQKQWGLDLDAAAQMKGRLETFVRDQGTQAENQRKAAWESNNDSVIHDAHEGKLNLLTLWDRVQSQGIDHVDRAVAEQAAKVMVNPAAEDDPGAFVEAERQFSEVRAGNLKPPAAVAWLQANASKFARTTWKQRVEDVMRARDPQEALGKANVVLFDKLIDDHYEVLKTFGDYGTPEAEKKYLDAKMRFRAAVRDPKLTDEQIAAAYQGIMAPAAQVGWWQRFWQQVSSAPGGRWYPLQNSLPAEPLLGNSLKINEAKPTVGEYQLSRPGGEPRTPEEFRAAVKDLAVTDKEAAQRYYDRWAGKWR
jgi:hypothetical protein